MDFSGVQYVKVDVDKLVKEERKQKKKEKKRLKKEQKKKKKASKKDVSSESSSGSEKGAGEDPEEEDHRSDDEYAPKETEGLGAGRDEWLTENSGRNILTGQLPQTQAVAKDPKPSSPKVSAKELNPDINSSAAAMKSSGATYGDGGASWRLKALKRAQARAEEEGVDVKTVVSERFASLAALTDGLGQQNAAHARAHLHASKDRQRQREGGESAGYLQDVGSGRSQMKRPDSSAMDWRKGRKSDGPSSSRRGEERRDGQRREESRRSEGGQERGGQGAGRIRDGERDGGRSTGREEARQHDGRRPKDEDRPQVRRGRPMDPAIAKGAAAALNTFSSDGTFLDSFRNQSGAAAAAAAAPADSPSSEPDGVGEADRQQQAAEPGDKDNRSAAALLRARLMGKAGPASSTSAALSSRPKSGAKQVQILPSVDAEGRAMPGAFGREAAGEGQIDGGRKVKKLQRYEEGSKQRYFADDDQRSLEDLVKEQRHGGGRDMDANLAENIARKARFRERDLDVDEEYDVDGGLDMYESRNRKVTKETAAKRQRTSQIADLRRTNNALDNCNLCFGSTRMAKHLTIALAQTAYLAIPDRGRLSPLHCCIVPMEHISSSRKTDEHVWTEMRNFKKCIIQMFMAEGQNAVFLETAMRLADARSHAVVHCIPLPDAAFHRAPIVFKKALLESESEWSQHNAKAAIDTKLKGLKGSIPPNFPYLFVEFGLSAGYLHVIDDEEKFDKDFGRSVLAGLLQQGAETQHRGARAEPYAVQQKLAADFGSKFDPFDWTKQL